MAGDDASAAAAGAAAATPGIATEGFDPASLNDKWGEVLVGLETKQQEDLQAVTLEELREEYSVYLQLVNTHPRMLVGREVPALSGEDGETETMRDEADALSWQESIKQLLNKEAADRVSRKTEDVGR